MFGAKAEPGSSQRHPHSAFYKAKSISACSLGRSPTYVSVSWMGSHSLGKNDLIITVQPSRQHLSATHGNDAGKSGFPFPSLPLQKSSCVKYKLKHTVLIKS